MTPEQFKKAEPIIKRLNNTQDALKQHRKWLKDQERSMEDAFGDIMDDYIPEVGVSQNNCVLCQYADGSGWKIDMSGAYIAKEVMEAVVNVLEIREAYYIEQLQGI